MIVIIDIADDIANQLGIARSGDAARSALEIIALAGYRDGSLNSHHVQRLLGFDNRWDTEEWLGSRGASMQYTADDLETDRMNLDITLTDGQRELGKMMQGKKQE